MICTSCTSIHFINWANKSACVLLSLAEVVADTDVEDVGGDVCEVVVDVVLSDVAAALAVLPGFPKYFVKQTGDLCPVFPQ